MHQVSIAANWPIYPTTEQTVLTLNGNVNEIEEAIKYNQDFIFPPPEGYEFVSDLGVGGCGKVYLANYLKTGTRFAVKCVININNYTRLMAAALSNEMDILQGCPHVNVITCFEKMENKTDPSITYLILEYMNEGSVRQWYSKYVLSEKSVRECIIQVLRGLTHLHKKRIVHRDIKADNILKNNEGLFKIADFGLTKECYKINGIYGLQTTGIGTLTHMAPEVMNTPQDALYDKKADVWSLGCLVLEMLNRGPPQVNINTQPVTFTAPQITPQCINFVQWCLTIDPKKRPDTDWLSNHDWFNVQLI